MEKIRSLPPVTVYVVVPNLPKAALIEWQVMARNHLCDINSELYCICTPIGCIG